MSQPPRYFVHRLLEIEDTFSEEQVRTLFPELKPSTVGVYLSLAKRAGYVDQVGLKKYRHGQRVEPSSPLPRIVQSIAGQLRGELMPTALERLVLWCDDDVASFVSDGFPVPFAVIEGDAASLAAAARVLERTRSTIVVRNHQELARRIWDESAEVFLLPARRVDSTRLLSGGFRVPTLGRLLIPLLHMPAVLPTAALLLVSDPRTDLRETVLALPSRRAALRLGAFLAWLVDKHPDLSIRAQAERFLPERMESW